MKYLTILIAALALTLSSCNKENISPNKSNTSIDDTDFDPKSGGSGNNYSSSECDNGGTITDPNNDEDENKKVKKGKK